MAIPISSLSGGWRMRGNLACVLFQRCDIMILDEPTNFLDLLGIMWLQQFLAQIRSSDDPRTVIIVSHDRDFVDSTCDEVIILKDHSLTYFSGTLSEYETDLRERIQYLTNMQENQEKDKTRIEKTIAAQVKAGKAGDDNKLRMASTRQKKLERNAGMMVGLNGGRFKQSRDRMGMRDFFRF